MLPKININMKKPLKVKVYQTDWIPGFSAFIKGSVKKNAEAIIGLNLISVLGAVELKEIDKKEVPYVVAKLIMHEVIHALEEWADVEFNEKRVEELIEEYKKE
jgi:hypothetical protein